MTLVSRNAERIKAILILVVVADHNDWLRQFSPALFDPLTFHVLGFFLLSFTFGEKIWCYRFVLDRAVRYLIPFFWVLTASSLAFGFMYKSKIGFIGHFENWLLAALIGNAPFVKASSGLMMLWFMPCLFGLTCLLAYFDSLKSNWARKFAIVLAVAAHLSIPLLPSGPMLWLPFGLAIAMDIFFLGIIWRKLLLLRLPRLWGPTISGIFIATYGVLVSVPVHLEIATLSLAGITNPLVLFLQDISGIAGVLSVIWLVSIPKKALWLESFGKNSLLVYLLHPFVYVLVGKLLGSSYRMTLSPLKLLVIGCLSTFFVAGLAYLITRFISHSRLLSEWLTPRSLALWPLAKIVGKAFPCRGKT